MEALKNVPVDPTDEMIAAANKVDWSNEDERAATINVWHAMVSAAPSADPRPAAQAVLENILEDAAKAAFVKAQGVYRGDHDHFPLRATWETTTESVREGWRGIAYAALEAAHMPPLGTQPEPRQARDVASALTAPVSQEPVAWQAFCVRSGGQMVHTIKSRLIDRADSLYGKNQWRLTPLYPSPQPLAEGEPSEAELKAALEPFAQAWEVATHHKDLVAKLTMAQLGELAAHEVSGVHFRNAQWALAAKSKGGQA